MSVQLRNYQATAVSECFKLWNSNVLNLLVVAAVGAGKTVIASRIIQLHLQAPQKRVLFLAHREELLQQTKEKLAFVDPSITCGIEQGRNYCPDRAQVMVASIATVRNLDRLRRWSPLENISLVIVDEAHHGTSTSYIDVLYEIGKANPQRHLLGITATPIRLDGENLSLVFDTLAFRIDMAELIDQKYLCPIRGYTIQTKTNIRSVPVNHEGDFDPDKLAAAIDTADRNRVIVESYLKHGESRPAIAFVANVAHAEHLAQEFAQRGIAAKAVHGKMERDERNRRVTDYQKGKLQVLTNCNVLCLDAQTQILTESGWVGVEQMSYAHKIANWDNGQIYFAEPKFIVRRSRCPGERMVICESQTQSIRVTEDHRMLIQQDGRWELVHARNLVHALACFPVAGVVTHERSPDLSLVDCQVLGFCLASAQAPEHWRIELDEQDPRRQWIDPLLQQGSFPVKARSMIHGVWRWDLSPSAELTRLQSYLAAPGTQQLCRLSQHQFEALLSGLLSADGARVSGCNAAFFDALQAAAACHGYQSTLQPGEQALTLTMHRAENSGPQQLRFEEGWRDEQVWCVTSHTGNIVTRRHGKVCVTGNTEGFDAPHTGVVIMGRPTKSPVVFPQQVGRGLRLHPSKKDCIIIDLVDLCSQTFTLPKLFKMPERMVLEGDNIRQIQRVAERAKAYHPEIDWETERTFETKDIIELLQPPSFSHLAETIVPNVDSEITWFPLEKDFLCVVDNQARRVARLTRDELGDWHFQLDQTRLRLGGRRQDAIFCGTAALLPRLTEPEIERMRSRIKPGGKPTEEQIRELKDYQIPAQRIETLDYAGATLLLQRLHFTRYVFRSKGQMQQGKYVGQNHQIIWLWDPDYMENVGRLNARIAEKIQPLHVLYWMRKNRPEVFSVHRMPSFDELVSLCRNDPVKFHAVMRAAMAESPEFHQMKAQFQQYRRLRWTPKGENVSQTI